jgi:hypothetical protein
LLRFELGELVAGFLPLLSGPNPAVFQALGPLAAQEQEQDVPEELEVITLKRTPKSPKDARPGGGISWDEEAVARFAASSPWPVSARGLHSPEDVLPGDPGRALPVAGRDLVEQLTMLPCDDRPSPRSTECALGCDDDAIPQPVNRVLTDGAVRERVHGLVERAVRHHRIEMPALRGRLLGAFGHLGQAAELGRSHLSVADACGGELGVQGL